MSVVTTPCEANPEDWFIERDGKQYRDDELVSQETIDAMLEVLYPDQDCTLEQIDEVSSKLEADAKRAALIRRRKARDACHFECPVRLRCLALGLQEENLEHGTWGGYYSEEREKIEDLRKARAAVRVAAQEE